MIRKVSRIKSFGAFDDFTWPSSLHEFKQFNLLFGWNYSGKTTLSRTFRCFELLKRHADFDEAEVHLHCEDGAIHTLSTTTGPHHYRVFNVDFVRDNLRFDEGTAEPILILGATDIAKQDALKAKQVLLASLLDEIRNATETRNEIEAGLERAMTASARDNIKTPLKRINYDKNKLSSKVAVCGSDPAQYILSDAKYVQMLETHNSTDKRAAISVLTGAALTPLPLFLGGSLKPLQDQ